jgi:hypothetical protein
MKSELRVVPHSELPGQNVIEVWHDGEFIATVTGATGPGVRVISKYINKVAPPEVTVANVPGAGFVSVVLRIR